MGRSWNTLRIDTAYTYNGIDALLLENQYLRILVLPGKGGDILEFRDKRADVDVLWHADHNWQSPHDRSVPSLGPSTWLDHYPGGWQVNLPVAGFTDDFGGTPYGMHGESSLVPWETTVLEESDERIRLKLETDLVRYPFSIERELQLPADEPAMNIVESVTNHGDVELEYIWQQHLALGPPLVGPSARLDLPTHTGVVEEYGTGHENARLKSGATFDWPHAPGGDGETVDMRTFPPYDATIHDVVYATDLQEGWYAVTNPELDLGFGFTFPTDLFECIWYWQPFGGHAEAPYWNRNYNVGLEPTTAYPAGDVPEAQHENGTIKHLEPGETVEATFTATTYRDVESVSSIDADGAVSPDSG